MRRIAIPALAAAAAVAIAILVLLRRRRRATGDPLPGAATGVTGEGTAPAAPRRELGVRLATPPIETPGPSVPAPALPESDTERAEWADATVPDPEGPWARPGDDPLVAEQEAAAAAEAAAIGGV